MSKIKSMKNMLCRAFKERIHVDYVLMDIWFTFYDPYKDGNNIPTSHVHEEK